MKQSRRRSPEEALREFVSLMGTTVSLDAATNDAADNSRPKNRLDHLLSTNDDWSARMKSKADAGEDADGGGATATPPRPASTFPSLSLFPPRRASSSSDCGPKHSNAARMLAQNSLGSPVLYGPADVSDAPERMARAVAGSFSALVGANLRSYAKKCALQSGADPCKVAERMEKAPPRVGVVSTLFALPSERDSVPSTGSCQLPLDAKFAFDTNVGGVTERIIVNAKGQINCSAAPQCEMLDCVSVNFDYLSMLLSLRQHARLVAYKFITQAPSTESVAAQATAPLPTVSERRTVTPCSSPLLSILSEAATMMSEPIKVLDLSGPSSSSSSSSSTLKRLTAAATLECPARTLPPKKRVRRAVSPLLEDAGAAPALTGLAVLAAGSRK